MRCKTITRTVVLFLSTPSGWRATRPHLSFFAFLTISIHALRVEGDYLHADYAAVAAPISIHALRVEGDRPHLSFFAFLTISIHALRVEGDKLHEYGQRKAMTISIHALRVEGDKPFSAKQVRSPEFLSTPSGWRATAKTDKVFVCFCAKGRRICLFKTRKEKICRWRFKKDKFGVLIWCEGSGKSVCALASHCG